MSTNAQGQDGGRGLNTQASTPAHQVFGTFFGLTVESGDEGEIVMRQGANVIAFPPELASNVTFAIGQAERGDR